jgi:hypothetical protein
MQVQGFHPFLTPSVEQRRACKTKTKVVRWHHFEFTYDRRILTCDPPIQPSNYEQSSCGSSRDNNPTTTMTTCSCGEEPTPADGEHLLPDTPGGISFAQLCEDDCTAIPPDRDVCREDSRNRHRLYLSHALPTWNSRVFEFGAYLFLAGTWPRSLLPASIYALVRAAAAALFSPILIYDYTQKDRVPRLFRDLASTYWA